ncbi:MAG: sulfurtransferase [Pseudomonadota bacterium]
MYRTLISTDELVPHLGESDWAICDCRHDLSDLEFGRRAYAQGHLPDASFLHLDEDLSGFKTGQNGRHPLPDPEQLAAKLGSLGIGNNTQVVAYDAHGGMYAARLWWLLRWLGHETVAVLDGGITKWIAEGKPVNNELPKFTPQLFERSPGVLPVNATFVLTHVDGKAMQLIDARSPDRFAGQNETLDPVAGHIPTAMNRFFKLNLNENGFFKPADLIRQEFKTLLADRDSSEVVHQCGSGVTACHNLLAMEHAGLTGSRLYPGSWSEWCADPGRPITKRVV